MSTSPSTLDAPNAHSVELLVLDNAINTTQRHTFTAPHHSEHATRIPHSWEMGNGKWKKKKRKQKRMEAVWVKKGDGDGEWHKREWGGVGAS